MRKTPRTIFFVVNLRSHLVELLRVAIDVVVANGDHPVFIFTSIFEDFEQDVQQLLQLKIVTSDIYGNDLKNFHGQADYQDFIRQHREAQLRQLSKIQRLLMRILYLGNHYLPEGSILRTPVNLYFDSKALEEARALFRRFKPSLLVMPSSVASYRSTIWFKVARDLKIPSVIVPYVYRASPEMAYKTNEHFSYARFFNRLFGAFYPQWVFRHEDGYKMLRLPINQALSMQWLGMAPPKPWVLHSSTANAIAVDSEKMREIFLQDGLPAHQLVLTGGLANDDLAVILRDKERLREYLYSELGLSPHKPMLLCSLPPNQLNTSNSNSDFPNYEELIRYWITTLQKAEHYNLVVNLHPRITVSQRHFVESLGAKISFYDTAKIIPLCNIFVASVTSVIRWAIACGIPVINYDVFRYRYQDFRNVPGVIEVEEQAELEAYIQRLTQDPLYYAEVKAKQETVKEYWGKLDGKARMRMSVLFEDLMEKQMQNVTS